MKWLYKKWSVSKKWIRWVVHKAQFRIKRTKGLVWFALKMLCKPKGTVFTLNGEVVGRLEYISGLIPLLMK